MPRQHTPNPLTIKTGDYVFLPIFKDNFKMDGQTKSSFKYTGAVEKLYVSEILQTVSSVDTRKSKRNFKFVLLADAYSVMGTENKRFIADEQAPMFKTSSEAKAWLTERIEETFKSVDGHEERQKEYGIFKLIEKALE